MTKRNFYIRKNNDGKVNIFTTRPIYIEEYKSWEINPKRKNGMIFQIPSSFCQKDLQNTKRCKIVFHKEDLILLKEKYQRKIIKLTLILVLSFLGIQYTIYPKLFFEFNLFEIFITSFSIIIFSAFHFYNMLNEKKEFYYINMGILLYLFGSTILFLVGNLTVTLSREFTKIPWILNALFYVFYQLFVLYEWKKSFSKKELETNL